MQAIFGFIVRVFLWLSASPFIKAIVNGFLTDLKEEGQKMIPVILTACKEAAADPALTTATKRFDYVFRAVKGAFPDAADSLINTLIETAYRYVTKPEVDIYLKAIDISSEKP